MSAAIQCAVYVSAPLTCWRRGRAPRVGVRRAATGGYRNSCQRGRTGSQHTCRADPDAERERGMNARWSTILVGCSVHESGPRRTRGSSRSSRARRPGRRGHDGAGGGVEEAAGMSSGGWSRAVGGWSPELGGRDEASARCCRVGPWPPPPSSAPPRPSRAWQWEQVVGVGVMTRGSAGPGARRLVNLGQLRRDRCDAERCDARGARRCRGAGEAASRAPGRRRRRSGRWVSAGRGCAV